MTFRSTLAIGCLATATLFAQQPARAQAPAPEARFTGSNQLVIDFPDSVQAWDNRIGDGGLRMQPEVPRTCRWDSDTRLACSFEKTPKLATRYRIDLHAGLRTWDGTRLPARTLFAETARPELYAAIREWRSGVPQIDVTSNTPLTPQALQAVLRLRIDGAPVALPMPLRLPSDWEASKHRRLRLVLPRIDGANRLLQLEVVPGLRSTEGPLTGTQEDTLLQAMAMEPFALRGLTCHRREGEVGAVNKDGAVVARCLPGMPIRLEFSQPLASGARDRLADRLPPGMTLSRDAWWTDGRIEGVWHSRGDWLIAEAQYARSAYALTLDGLRSQGDEPLAPVRIDLTTDPAPPQFVAPRTAALLADRAQRPALVQAIDAGDAAIDVDAVGARAHHETVRATGQEGATVPVASSVARRALADGGWVRWTPVRDATRRGDPRGSIGPAEFAAPAFDLYTVQGVREVLVWANQWDRDAAVAGADVELLLRERADETPRVVARGITGADGVALLRLPDDLRLPDNDEHPDGAGWWVRASQGRRGGRAVMPLSLDWSHLGHALERVTWGVSDRPMYRPGDTVHYRLWRRDRNGARLQAVDTDAPLTLRLHDENEGKAITQWQAAPSPAGDIAGELTLPVHLTDGTYCIGVPAAHGYRADGACFFVGVYRAQDLWAQLSVPAGVLRDGQRLGAGLKAGYYSGGSAAGVAIEQVDLSIEPLPFDEAYPQYAPYAFIDVDDDAYESVDIDVDATDSLDREGQARLAATLPVDGNPKRPPFGALALWTEVAPQGREATVASDATVLYSRYPAFVGLRTIPQWPRGDAPVELEGVVVDADGRALPEATITVDVTLVSGDEASEPRPLAQCTLRAGVAGRCDFPRPGSGRYRFTA